MDTSIHPSLIYSRRFRGLGRHLHRHFEQVPVLRRYDNFVHSFRTIPHDFPPRAVARTRRGICPRALVLAILSYTTIRMLRPIHVFRRRELLPVLPEVETFRCLVRDLPLSPRRPSRSFPSTFHLGRTGLVLRLFFCYQYTLEPRLKISSFFDFIVS